jgi:hypothetical protein
VARRQVERHDAAVTGGPLKVPTQYL